MQTKLGSVGLLVLALVFSVGVGPGLARGHLPTVYLPNLTAFTYQGRLTEGGNPATGMYDFEFKLFDALSGGNQVGPTLSKNEVGVTQGLFTLELDFGAGVFTTTARYLEIAVRAGTSTGAYTLLTPRQALTPTPQALFAQGAPWAGLSEVPAGFADGVDNDTLYTAGTGLTLASQEFAIDTTLVQARITNACPAESSIRQILETGAVVCEADDVGASGVLTVTPGLGLSGGGSSTVVTLTVMFAGAGSANTAARSDHTHNALTGANGTPANALYVDTVGQVGIGTTTPGAPLDVMGSIRSNRQLISTVGAGIPPLVVSSPTLVTNLNADLLDGYHAGNNGGNLALNNGTLNINLNADLLDGQESSYYLNASNLTTGTLNPGLYSAYADLNAEGYLNNSVGDVALNNGVLQANLNADLFDGQHSTYYLNASNITTGTFNPALYSAYTDLSIEGYLNNGLGDLALNNGVVQANLNADLLDGYQAGNNNGNLALNNGLLNANLNADWLDGQHSTYYLNASNLNAGTLGTNFYSAYGDLGAEGYLGNAVGDVALNNGTLNSNLNADMLDGIHASGFAPATHSHYALDAIDGSPTNAVYVDSAGRVGINTTTFQGLASLQVGQAGVGQPSVLVFGQVDRDPANLNNIPQFATYLYGSPPGITARYGMGHYYGLALSAYEDDPGDPHWGVLKFYTGGDGLPLAEHMRLDYAGNLGIGTANPGMPLDVVGNIRSSGQFISTLSTGTAPLAVSSSTLVTNLNADMLDGIHASSFVTSAHTHWGQTWTGSGVGLTLKDGWVGLAGIGSSTGLSGTATGNTGSAYGVYGQGGTTSATNFGLFGQAEDYGVYGLAQTAAGTWGSTVSTDTSTGGAQGVAPNTHGVLGQTNAAARAGAKGIGGLEVPLAPTPPVGLWGTSVSGHGGYLTNNTGAYSTLWLANTSGAGLLIEAYGASTSDREFYVSSNGTVGADGFYYGAGYLTGSADFAEMLPAQKGLEPGDVLVIGPAGQLIRSTAPNQTNVVGVYSTQPGFVGGAGENADLTGKVPLAIVGVVPVKVTAANGPIKPGDLLTTSALPGHAMKATPITLSGYTFYPTGTILGKALAAWPEGTGIILMLVMVQ